MNVRAARLARLQVNVDYFSCALIEFLVSQIYKLIEIKMVVSKPELRR
jgi:hypothetical protein